MINFFKKYWLILLLATVATLLGFFWFQNRNKDQQGTTLETPQIVTNLGQNINRSNVAFEVKNELPTQANVLTVEKRQPYASHEAEVISSLLGFSPSDFSENSDDNLKIWVKGGLSLVVSLSENYIKYQRDLILEPAPKSPEFPNIDQLSGQLRELLPKVDNTINPANFKQEVSYLIFNGYKPVESDAQSADIVEIRIKYSLEEVNLIKLNGTQDLGYVWFDRTGKIVRLELSNTIQKLVKSQEYPLQTLPEIRANFATQAKLLSTDLQSDPNPSNFASYRIENIYLSYLETSNNMAIPVFILEGYGLGEEISIAKVNLFIPAIKSAPR